MRSWLAILVFFASPAIAQTLVVKKVKGNQAIVDVTNGTVNVGQKIGVPQNGGETDELELTASTTGPRRHSIGISTGVSLLKSETGSGSSYNNTNMSLQGSYGWNKGAFEFGFIGLLGMSDSGSGNLMSYGAGGFFDWNFKPNKPGNDMIFGAGFHATYEIQNQPSPASALNTMDLYPSVFMKWFVLGTPTAFRFDFGYKYAETGSGSSKTKNSGFAGEGGFEVYF